MTEKVAAWKDFAPGNLQDREPVQLVLGEAHCTGMLVMQ